MTKELEQLYNELRKPTHTSHSCEGQQNAAWLLSYFDHKTDTEFQKTLYCHDVQALTYTILINKYCFTEYE